MALEQRDKKLVYYGLVFFGVIAIAYGLFVAINSPAKPSSKGIQSLSKGPVSVTAPSSKSAIDSALDKAAEYKRNAEEAKDFNVDCPQSKNDDCKIFIDPGPEKTPN